MTYSFEQENGTFQLVENRWYWIRKKKHDIHLEYDPMKRLIMTAKDKADSASNKYQTLTEASQLARILRNAGVDEIDLLEATFPKDTNQRTIDLWAHILNWLSTCHEQQTEFYSR
jgi:3-dehydroquinate dehydratase